MKKTFLFLTLIAFIAILTIPTPPAFAYKKAHNKKSAEQKKEDDPYGGGVDVVYYLGKVIGYSWWKPDAIKGEYRYDKNNDVHTTYGVLVFEFGK